MHTYTLFGDRVFLPSACPQARIPPSAVLAVLPQAHAAESGVLELPPSAFDEYVALSARTQKTYESLFSVWAAKRR